LIVQNSIIGVLNNKKKSGDKSKMKSLSKLLITAGMIGLATLFPAKEAQAQKLGGWLEATAGTPAENLRIYPEASLWGINAKSLIDINGYSPFSKTDVSFSGLETNSRHFTAKPVITMLKDKQDGAKMKAGLNLSYPRSKIGRGFIEASIDIENPKSKSSVYTYNGITMFRGNYFFGVFTSSPSNDFSKTYVEVEMTGPKIIKGISLYSRMNVQKGVAPSYQAGISLNPIDLYDRIKKKER